MTKIVGLILQYDFFNNALMRFFFRFLADLLVDQTDQTHLSNGIVDSKAQTILTSAGKTHFSPIGPLHLTAEECNEILMKRALAASHPQSITANDGHATSASKA